jgi:hypothetical protein
MKHVPDSAAQGGRPKDIDELRRTFQRRRSNFNESWRRCANPVCRRQKRCCGDGVVLQCAHDGVSPRTYSREETAKAMSELYHALQQRRAELAAGAKPGDENESRKGRAPRRRRAAPARAQTQPAASPPHDVAKAAPPAAEAPKLTPEQHARLDRAWNDYVTEQEKPARAPGPRITRL